MSAGDTRTFGGGSDDVERIREFFERVLRGTASTSATESVVSVAGGHAAAWLEVDSPGRIVYDGQGRQSRVDADSSLTSAEALEAAGLSE